MVYNKSFHDIKNDMLSFISHDEKPAVAEQVPQKEPYPVAGKHMYTGMPSNAPYAHPQLEPGSIYKMPGIRGKWYQAVEKVWNKKLMYTTMFIKGFLAVGISVILFMLLPFPYSLAGYVSLFYAFYKLMEGHNTRLACYAFEMNMGYVGGLVYDGSYATKNDYWGKKKVLAK